MTRTPDTIEHRAAAIDTRLDTLAPATRRAYQASLVRLGALDTDVTLDDTTLSAALRTMADAGYSAATLRQALHAARWRARSLGDPDPAGPLTALIVDTLIAAEPAAGSPAVDWDTADRTVAELLELGDELRDIRAAALVAVISDGLLRVKEAVPLDIEAFTIGPDGTARLDLGTRAVVMTAATMAVVSAWTDAANITSGRLWRSLRDLDAPDVGVSAATIRVELRRVLNAPARSLRLGSAASLAAHGATSAEIKDAGGWASETRAAALVRSRRYQPAHASSAVARYRT